MVKLSMTYAFLDAATKNPPRGASGHGRVKRKKAPLGASGHTS
jgi:hypothetical protein